MNLTKTVNIQEEMKIFEDSKHGKPWLRLPAKPTELDFAKAFTEKGLSAVVVRGKIPFNKWKTVATCDFDKLLNKHLLGENGYNLALTCGNIKGSLLKLFVIDLDNKVTETGKTGVEEFDDFCKKHGTSLGEMLETNFSVKTGSGGYHIYFLVPAGTPVRQTASSILPGVDSRYVGGYIIAPGAIHQNGNRYELLNNIEPLMIPDFILARFKDRSRGKVKPILTPDYKQMIPMSSEDSSSDSYGVKEGSRNDTLFRALLKYIKANNVTAEELMDFAIDLNDKFDPPLENHEVIATAKSAFNIATTSREIDLNTNGEISTEECLSFFENNLTRITNNGKSFAIDKDGSTYTLNNGKETYNHQYVVVESDSTGKSKQIKMNAFEYWWKNTEDRRYGIEFLPNPTEEELASNIYNTWKGYAYEPNPEGVCDMFLEFLLVGVCQGNEILFNYVMDVFAQMIQQPREKIGIALVLVGKQGAGKSIVGEVIGRLYHPNHFQQVDSFDKLTARFNSALEGNMVNLCDEILWGGNNSSRQKIKSLLTCLRITIERKGIEPYDTNDFTRYIMTSNEKWSTPVEKGDRRFCVMEVGDNYCRNREFFGAMIQQLEDGGYGKLLHVLQTRDYSDREFLDIPKTRAKLEEQIQGFDLIDKWIIDLVFSGRHSYHVTLQDKPIQVTTKNVQIDFSEYLDNMNENFQSSRYSGQIGKTLKGLLKIESKRVGKDRASTYIFPSQEECEKLIGEALDVDINMLKDIL